MTTLLTKLPVYATSFIGRDRSEHAVSDLFSDGTLRMLTLVGASGSGKTRLSVQVAAHMASDFPDGCVFVSLAPVTDPDLVLPTIGHSLDLSDQGGVSVLESLATALRSKRMLLILDNMEQVREAAPQLNILLEQTEALRVMVTSQVSLEVPCEIVYQVPPLALPQEPVLDIEVLPTYSAIALFIDRMRQVQPTFRITHQNSAALVEICQLVEGLPLAIELIAAHSAVFTPQDLLFFLHQHLSLGRLQHSLDSRARIIRPILDWCVSRLEPAYQQLFFRLGIFVGGWTLESATQVCNAADDLGVDIVEAMEMLHRKHLILEEMLWGQEQRYLMLDTVHEYTQKRLRTLRQIMPLSRSHADYFTTLAAQAYESREGEQQGSWLEHLESEYHNIRAALRWIARQAPSALGTISLHLGFFWRMRGYLHEGRQWLTTALDAAAQLPAAQSASLAHALSLILLDLADYTAAQTTLDLGMEYAQAAADPLVEARILHGLGRLTFYQGRLADSLAYSRRNLDLYHRLGDRGGEARLLSNIALILVEQGQHQEALAMYQQSLQLAQALGNTFSESITLTNMGQVYWTLGDFPQAITITTRALAMAETLGDQHGIALNHINMGELRSREGDYRAARDHLQQGIRLAREAGLADPLTQGLIMLAGVVLKTGNRSEAQQTAAEALGMIQTHELITLLPEMVEHVARIAIADQRWTDAARFLGYADAQRQILGVTLGPTTQRDYQELVLIVQAQLTPSQWDLLAAEGQSLSVEDLLPPPPYGVR